MAEKESKNAMKKRLKAEAAAKKKVRHKSWYHEKMNEGGKRQTEMNGG